MTRKALERGFVAGIALLLAVHLPSVTLAQDGIDPVTGFAREPVHVAAWPGGRKVAVGFALFVEEFGLGQGPVFRPDLARNAPLNWCNGTASLMGFSRRVSFKLRRRCSASFG
jgi:allantoinase